MVTKGAEGGGGVDWDLGIGMCTLLYVEWMGNAELQYSTEKFTQYPVITCTGMDMCICISESLCYIAEINTTSSISCSSRTLKKDRGGSSRHGAVVNESD